MRRCAEYPDAPGRAVSHRFVGSAFLAVAGGILADLFIPQQLLLPVMVFTGAPLIGSALGPVVGGFINSFTTWWIHNAHLFTSANPT